MTYNYSNRIQTMVIETNADNFDDETDELISLVNDYDRSFSDGLAELINRTSRQGSLNTPKDKTGFICSKLETIGIQINDSQRKTIRNWVNGRTVPEQEARERIFELCFALSASFQDVCWFFNHVCLQRSFNCHRIDEAVYYYCFKNSLGYAHARKLISEIEKFPKTIADDCPSVFYTREITMHIDHCSTDEELKQYFKHNKAAFLHRYMNQRAKEYIEKLLDDIRGKKSDMAIIQKARNGQINERHLLSEIADCGLIVQEILVENEPAGPKPPKNSSLFFDISTDYLTDKFNNQDISSIAFMLNCIYEGKINTRNINLPEKRRKNFPSEKVFSQLLSSFDVTANYDSIRKCMILLKFYHFWCRFHIDPSISNSIPEETTPYEVYLSETNDLLMECGYDGLYAGNAYDRLFMYCAKSLNPLWTLRSFVART